MTPERTESELIAYWLSEARAHQEGYYAPDPNSYQDQIDRTIIALADQRDQAIALLAKWVSEYAGSDFNVTPMLTTDTEEFLAKVRP